MPMRRFSFSLFLKKLHPSPAFPSLTKTLSTLLAVLLLTACGGGGGSDNLADLQESAGNAAASSGEETLRIGNGTGANFTQGTLATNDADLEAGESTTININVVNQNNEAPTSSFTINVTSACVGGGLATVADPVQVTPGFYTVEYTAQGCAGADTVTARIEGTTQSATIDLNVNPPLALTVSFVESTLNQLTLAGIGGDESTELTFRVAGAQGVPIIGAQVSFSINSPVGGAFILANRLTGITDTNGEVRTILNSGSVAGPVNVRAVHDATGLQGVSDDIIISTGVPEYSRFSVSYDPFNPADAFNTDGINVNISIIASDQFGNNPTEGSRISFVAPESGNIQNSCELSDGACTVTWRSTSPRPANGRLEIITYTDGAEDFVDNNGNSVYDAADGAIIDLGEPYADENEDGDYDLGEFFFDSNQNGVRDGGNGEWDGPCLALVVPTAVCDGNPTVSIFDTVTVVMSTNTPRILNSGTFGPTGFTINITQGTNLPLTGMIIGDNNTNADPLGSNPMPAGTSIAFSIDGAGVSLVGATSFEVPNATGPTGPYGITLKADEVAPADPLPLPALLFLTVTPPNAQATQFSWTLSVLR